jgi:Na+/proline symporter
MATLRIIFTILSALCLAAILPAGTFGGLFYVFICAGGAGVFFLLMLFCKRIHEGKEPKEKTPDFLNSDEKSENSEEK